MDPVYRTRFVEWQPRWRVAIVDIFARMMGVFIRVEGIPLGSTRHYLKRREASSTSGSTTGGVGEGAQTIPPGNSTGGEAKSA